MASLKKIQAFSLIEVLVAMIIILLLISLTTLVFINLSGFDRNQNRISALYNMQSIINETRTNNSYINEDYPLPNMTIKKIIEDYPESPNLKIMIISSFTLENKLILEKKEIVRIPNFLIDEK